VVELAECCESTLWAFTLDATDDDYIRAVTGGEFQECAWGDRKIHHAQAPHRAATLLPAMQHTYDCPDVTTATCSSPKLMLKGSILAGWLRAKATPAPCRSVVSGLLGYNLQLMTLWQLVPTQWEEHRPFQTAVFHRDNGGRASMNTAGLFIQSLIWRN
jgi:hypothetical protein